MSLSKQNSKHKPHSNIFFSDNIPSAGLLKPPPIPNVGDYFDVMIPCAVNPYNFFVSTYLHLNIKTFFYDCFSGATI